MTEELTFISKHEKHGALLDANLLLVYLVGKYFHGSMRSFHHTKQYVDDFPLIERLVEKFRILYTTPNVLTEVSNLGGKLGSGFYDVLQLVIPIFTEKYCSSKEATVNPHFNKIGLTDSGLMRMAGSGVLVITTDWILCGILRKKNIDAVNFNHLRISFWTSSL